MADAVDSKSTDREVMGVRLPPPAPKTLTAINPVFNFTEKENAS